MHALMHWHSLFTILVDQLQITLNTTRKMLYEQYDIFSFALALVTGYVIGYSTAFGNEVSLPEEVEGLQFMDVILPYYSVFCVVAMIGMMYKEFISYGGKGLRFSPKVGFNSTKSTIVASTNTVEGPSPVVSSNVSTNCTSKAMKEKLRPIKQQKQSVLKPQSLPPSALRKSVNDIQQQSGNEIPPKGNVPDINGSFKVTKFENMDAILSMMGAPWAARKIILSESPIHTYKVSETKLHIKVDGIQAMDNEYDIGAPPRLYKTPKTSFMDTVRITDSGIIRVTRVNETKQITLTFDRELSDDGKVLTMSITAEKMDGSKVEKGKTILERQ